MVLINNELTFISHIMFGCVWFQSWHYYQTNNSNINEEQEERKINKQNKKTDSTKLDYVLDKQFVNNSCFFFWSEIEIVVVVRSLCHTYTKYRDSSPFRTVH